MHDLTLTELWIYPVKSLGGVRVPSARVNPKGLEHDRRWMLVDEKGQFLTQRAVPTMALLNVATEPDKLIVTDSRSLAVIHIPLHQTPTGCEEEVVVWNDRVLAHEVSPETSAWFSERLEKPCRLVWFPEQNIRTADPTYAGDGQNVSLADGFPFLIIGEESLNDLNRRLAEPVPMNRFRPNFIFQGGAPFAEDQWHEFTIGVSRFRSVKPCGRCVMTTVDQRTALRGDEPLRTLSTYRKQNGSVLFGQNLVTVSSPGDKLIIKEGDVITLH